MKRHIWARPEHNSAASDGFGRWFFRRVRAVLLRRVGWGARGPTRDTESCGRTRGSIMRAYRAVARIVAREAMRHSGLPVVQSLPGQSAAGLSVRQRRRTGRFVSGNAAQSENSSRPRRQLARDENPLPPLRSRGILRKASGRERMTPAGVALRRVDGRGGRRAHEVVHRSRRQVLYQTYDIFTARPDDGTLAQ